MPARGYRKGLRLTVAAGDEVEAALGLGLDEDLLGVARTGVPREDDNGPAQGNQRG